MRRFGLLLALAVGLVALPTGCSQANTPMNPGLLPAHEQTPTLGGGDYDPIDDFLREGTAVIDGDVTINGLTETDPNYEPGPYVVTQPARTGDIAIFRVKAHLTNNATTTLYTKQTSPTKNYSSFSVPGTNVDQYKAMYVTGTEPLSITFYNSTSYNTPVNSKAAIYDYNFKTQAAENAGEPNDDDNGATITDRSLANNLVSGVTATRSVFSFDPATRDIEEWYKTTIGLAGEQFSFKYTTTSGRFGTWSYTLKVFDPNGVQMGSTVNVPAGNAAATVTRTATTSGTYYLQMVGTPVTKNNTNVYYNLYTITACVKPRLIEITTDPETICPGASTQWLAQTANGVTSYNWNFGGGCTPNTSTAASPIVNAGAPGEYPLTLTLSNGCESTTANLLYVVGCEGNVGIQGGVGGTIIADDILVEGNGTTHLLSYYNGTVDLDPSNGTTTGSAAGQGMAITRLSALGELEDFAAFTAAGSTSFTPSGMSFHPTHGYRIAGMYDGIVDFDPGASAFARNSAVHGRTFLLALDSDMSFLWVSCFDAAYSPGSTEFRPGTGDAFVVGAFQGTIDFDPGPSVFSRTSTAGNLDAYCMLFDNTGRLLNGVTWGSTDDEYALSLATSGSGVDIAGYFKGTVDFDPGAGTAPRTAAGPYAGYLLRLTADPDLEYLDAAALTGTGTSIAVSVKTTSNGLPRVSGVYAGTIDFDPLTGTQNRTSNGQNDVFLLSLDSNSSYQWVYTLGGLGTDGTGGLAMVPGTNEFRLYGQFDGIVDFDPGPGADVFTGSNAAFILGIDVNGNRDFVSIWDGDFITTSAIGVDANGVSRATGYFGDVVDFDPSAGVANFTSLGTIDVYLQRINADGNW